MIIRQWPKLFKKNSQGTLEEWKILVEETAINNVVTLNSFDIVISHGQENGQLQTTFDTVKEGKNFGKKNQTDAYSQAIAEAQSKYEKKLKAGYHADREAALAGKVDGLIKGGIVPMTAYLFEDHKHKIIYPCAVQPKLDGLRMIAVKENGTVTLWSRERRQFTSMPHIEQAIRELPFEHIILDGEAYNHEYKHEFSKIVSAVKKKEPSSASEKVQYHIYDIATPMDDFEGRFATLSQLIPNSSILKLVETNQVESEEDLMNSFREYRKLGYEGAMARNWNSDYKNRRSYDLLKIKAFDDSEFEIVGGEEGSGKLMGKLGAFICLADNGKEFRVTPNSTLEEKEEYWTNLESYKGRLLTVEFQGLTDAEQVPRCPKGLRLREEGL